MSILSIPKPVEPISELLCMSSRSSDTDVAAWGLPQQPVSISLDQLVGHKMICSRCLSVPVSIRAQPIDWAMLHSRNALLRKKIFVFSREPAPESHRFLLMDFVPRENVIFIIKLALARKSRRFVLDNHSRSDNEGAVKINRAEATMLFDPQVHRLGNAVEA